MHQFLAWTIFIVGGLYWLYRQLRKIPLSPHVLHKEIQEKEAAGIQPTVVDLVANGTAREERTPEEVHETLEEMRRRRQVHLHGVDAHGRSMYGTQEPQGKHRWW